MNFENPIVQKLNSIADWILRIIVVNFMVILFSLPLVTLFGSLSAGYEVIYDAVHKKNTRTISGFLTYFKQNFKKKFILGLLMTVLIVLGYVNVTYYVDILDEGAGLFYHLGYYVTLSFLVGAYIVSLYLLPVVKVYPSMSLKMTIKLAFFVSGKFFIRTMLMIISTLVPFLLLFTPFTSVIFMLAGLSLWLIISVMITNEVVYYLERLGKRND